MSGSMENLESFGYQLVDGITSMVATVRRLEDELHRTGADRLKQAEAKENLQKELDEQKEATRRMVQKMTEEHQTAVDNLNSQIDKEKKKACNLRKEIKALKSKG